MNSVSLSFWVLPVVAAGGAGDVVAAPSSAEDSARSRYEAGKDAESRGDLEAAMGHYAESHQRADAQRDMELAGWALNRLGLSQRSVGRTRDAVESHQRALALWESHGRRDGASQAHNNLGLALSDLGLTSAALDEFQRAWSDALAVAGRTPNHMVSSGLNLVREHRRRGDYGSARDQLDRLDRALPAAIAREAAGSLLYNRATLALMFDRFWEAEPLYPRARREFRWSSNRVLEGCAVLGLARIALTWHGDSKRADALIDEAEALFRAASDRHGQWSAALERAEVARESGDFATAARHVHDASSISAKTDLRAVARAGELGSLAETSLERGALDEAAQRAVESLVAARRAGSLIAEAHAVALLARVQARRGRPQPAESLVDQADRLFDALGAHDKRVGFRALVARELARGEMYGPALRQVERAAAGLPRVVSHRVRIQYDLAEAAVRLLACDRGAAVAALRRARARAQAVGDQLYLLRRVQPFAAEVEGRWARIAGRVGPCLASANGVRTVSGVPAPDATVAPPGVGATTGAAVPGLAARSPARAVSGVVPHDAAPSVAIPGPTAAPASPTVDGAAPLPSQPVVSLSPSAAYVRVAADGRARYRWLLRNATRAGLDARVWIDGEGPARVVAGDGGSAARAAQGAEATPVKLEPYESVAMWTEADGAGRNERRVLQIRARAGAAEVPVSALFVVEFSAEEIVEPLVGRGVEGDPLIEGIEFYHEVRWTPEAVAPFSLTVKASAPTRIELVDLATGALVAVDGTGDGRFDQRGDGVFADANQDLVPDVVPGGGDGVTRLSLVAYPSAEALAAGQDVGIELQARDGRGQVVAARKNLILLDRLNAPWSGAPIGAVPSAK